MPNQHTVAELVESDESLLESLDTIKESADLATYNEAHRLAIYMTETVVTQVAKGKKLAFIAEDGSVTCVASPHLRRIRKHA